MRVQCAAVLVCLAAAAVCSVSYAASSIVRPTGYVPVASSRASTLYQVTTAAGTGYPESPLKVVDLHGSSFYDMGYDYGRLLSKEINQTYVDFLKFAVHLGIEGDALSDFFLWQFHDFLAKYTPQEYLDEIRGIEDGGKTQGYQNLGSRVAAVVGLANMPGDNRVWGDILIEELADRTTDNREHFDPRFEFLMPKNRNIRRFLTPEFVGSLEKIRTFGCDYFAVWGSRSVGGQVLSSRNLDWMSRTGIANSKLIAVYNGTYAVIGYAGVVGALAGVNKYGVTVQQMNLMNKKNTYLGTPWLYRLRSVLHYAHDIADSISIFHSMRDTVAVNHGITSCQDGRGIAVESISTMNAFFDDNDPRESLPITEAVYRSNNVFDPTIKSTQTLNSSQFNESYARYALQNELITAFAKSGTKIADADAVDIASALGVKSGENIMSIVFHPALNAGVVYAAWERFSGAQWSGACNNAYMEIDMSQFWKP
eukprot:ANDGO_03290.mRNA.1 Protein dcd1B